jgi:hypothetical protein
MLGEGTQMNLVLGMGLWVLRMLHICTDYEPQVQSGEQGKAYHDLILEC